MLAAGLPLGRLAWGGGHRVLPTRLRIASLASVAVAVLGGLAVAQAAGLGPDFLPAAVLRPVLWTFTGLFALSFIANLAGASGAERLHGVPLTVILAASTAIVALSAPT